MLSYSELEDIEPSRLVEFPMKVDRTPPNWTPPISKLLTFKLRTPTYTRLRERLLSDNTKPRKWKPCEHYKAYTAYAVPDSNLIPWYSSSGTGTCNYSALTGADSLFAFIDTTVPSLFGAFGKHVKPKNGVTSNFPSLTVDRPDGGFVPKSGKVDEYCTASLIAMLPLIKADISLPNFLLELRDFRSLPTTLTNLANFCENLPRALQRIRAAAGSMRTIRRSFTRSAGNTLRESLRASGDAYLQSAFNIAPLLRDICSIYAALTQANKKINDLLARQGRRQKRHYSRTWLPTEYACTEDTASFSMNGGQYSLYATNVGETGCPMANTGMSLRCVRYAIVEQAEFHAEIEYNYNYTRFQAENAQILGFLDSLGVNLNPAIIWNAIPWSFLVDWLFGVSRWLNTMKTSNMDPVINITQFLWSTKVRRRVRCYVESNPTFAQKLVTQKTFLPDIYETAYRRGVDLPTSSSIKTSGLSSTEFSLGAALVITRRPQRKNWRRYVSSTR